MGGFSCSGNDKKFELMMKLIHEINFNLDHLLYKMAIAQIPVPSIHECQEGVSSLCLSYELIDKPQQAKLQSQSQSNPKRKEEFGLWAVTKSYSHTVMNNE